MPSENPQICYKPFPHFREHITLQVEKQTCPPSYAHGETCMRHYHNLTLRILIVKEAVQGQRMHACKNCNIFHLGTGMSTSGTSQDWVFKLQIVYGSQKRRSTHSNHYFDDANEQRLKQSMNLRWKLACWATTRNLLIFLRRKLQNT